MMVSWYWIIVVKLTQWRENLQKMWLFHIHCSHHHGTHSDRPSPEIILISLHHSLAFYFEWTLKAAHFQSFILSLLKVVPSKFDFLFVYVYLMCPSPGETFPVLHRLYIGKPSTTSDYPLFILNWNDYKINIYHPPQMIFCHSDNLSWYLQITVAHSGHMDFSMSQ